MYLINNFLHKFKKITPPDISIISSFSESVDAIMGIKIDPQKIYFDKKTGFIFLKTDNTQKTVIFLNKKEIIKETNKILSKNTIKDIK